MLNIVEKAANETLNESKANKLPVNVKRIAEGNNYHVLTYNCAAAKHLLSTFELLPYVAKYDGFSIRHGGRYYIFLSDDLTPENERIVIAHEIGHIKLHYEQDDCMIGRSSLEQEKEADAFTRFLLAPLPVLHSLNINNPEDIRKYTGLSLKDANLVLDALLNYDVDYHSISTQKGIEHNFFKFIKKANVQGKTADLVFKFLVPAFASVIILMLAIALIIQNADNGQVESTPNASDLPLTSAQSESTSESSDAGIVESGESSAASEPEDTSSDTASAAIANTDLPNDATYYWTDGGSVFHLFADCQSLVHIDDIHSGTLAEAEKAKDRLCKFCRNRRATETE